MVLCLGGALDHTLVGVSTADMRPRHFRPFSELPQLKLSTRLACRCLKAATDKPRTSLTQNKRQQRTHALSAQPSTVKTSNEQQTIVDTFVPRLRPTQTHTRTTWGREIASRTRGCRRLEQAASEAPNLRTQLDFLTNAPMRTYLPEFRNRAPEGGIRLRNPPEPAHFRARLRHADMGQAP